MKKYIVFEVITKGKGYIVEAESNREAEKKLAECDYDGNDNFAGVGVERYKGKDMTHDSFCQSEGVFE